VSTLRRFADIGILENRLRVEKFRELVVEIHNAHNSFKVYLWLVALRRRVLICLIVVNQKPGA
jgi:hypothetical protein